MLRVTRGAGAPPQHGARRMLYLENLTVSFDGFKALDKLTLYVDAGELRCIIGPNGAGKTTMMDVITGKDASDRRDRPGSGRDVNLLALSEPQIAQAGIGRKFQKPTVFEQLTVFENLELALAGPKSFLRMLVARLTAGQREHIDEVLERGGADGRARQTGRHAVARTEAVARDRHAADAAARTAADRRTGRRMTPQETERTAELLLSLAGEHSVIVVEHDMDFVRSIANRVTVLHEGRVLAEGDMDLVRTIRASSRSTLANEAAALEPPAVSALNQFYGGSHTLWDVTIDVPAGSRTCLMGATAWERRRCSSASWGCFRPHRARSDSRDGPVHAAGRGSRPARHRLRAAGA